MLKEKNKAKRQHRGGKEIAQRCISRCRHFQRCLPACLGFVVGIAKRLGAGVRANLSGRRQESETEREKIPLSPNIPSDSCVWPLAVSADVEVSADVIFVMCAGLQ